MLCPCRVDAASMLNSMVMSMATSMLISMLHHFVATFVTYDSHLWRGRGHLHQLAISLGLDQPMYIAIPNIVPNTLRFKLQGITMIAGLPVVAGVSRSVPPTPHMATYEADPQVCSGAAYSAARGACVGGVHAVAAHRAGSISPALQAFTMKAMIAHLHAQ